MAAGLGIPGPVPGAGYEPSLPPATAHYDPAVAGWETTGDEWITAPTAARLLGLQLNTVYAMIDRGELPPRSRCRRDRSAGGPYAYGAKPSTTSLSGPR